MLILHAEARRSARRNLEGDYVPLAEQDPRLWNAKMIAEAEALLKRASTFQTPGRYQLEAALQSAHVDRCRGGRDNWPDVVQLYDALSSLTGSPVVAINRALAIAELDGVNPALEELNELSADPRIADYQPYWAARADLLARGGKVDEARHAYDVAIGLQRDPAVRRFLQKRQAALSG